MPEQNVESEELQQYLYFANDDRRMETKLNEYDQRVIDDHQLSMMNNKMPASTIGLPTP